MRPRVLGLGNDLLGDDAVGVIAARQIKRELVDQVDVAETSVYGLGLLDVILGCRQLIIIDAIKSRQAPPGTVIQLDPATLDQVVAPSPHYSGIPEMRALARTLDLDFPQQIAIFAVEIADGTSFEPSLSEEVRPAVAEVVRQVKNQLAVWTTSSGLPSDGASSSTGDQLPARWQGTTVQNPC